MASFNGLLTYTPKIWVGARLRDEGLKGVPVTYRIRSIRGLLTDADNGSQGDPAEQLLDVSVPKGHTTVGPIPVTDES